MKIKLFGEHIEPACHYCERGILTPDHQTVSCKKYGAVSPYYSCKSFQYAPLKRIPKRASALPQFTKEDFKI